MRYTLHALRAPWTSIGAQLAPKMDEGRFISARPSRTSPPMGPQKRSAGPQRRPKRGSKAPKKAKGGSKMASRRVPEKFELKPLVPILQDGPQTP